MRTRFVFIAGLSLLAVALWLLAHGTFTAAQEKQQEKGSIGAQVKEIFINPASKIIK